jgi:spermidine synthase
MKTFRETLYPDHGQILSVDKVLYEGRTDHQDVLVFENSTFGKVLVLDDVVQLTEHDNHIYHEMMAHVPLMAHGAPRDVLIIGGGDGGTLKQVLKHPVDTAVLVELDPEVITLSRQYVPEISSEAFDDARTSVVLANGATYVAQTNKSFDAIIIDSTDPIGPGESLFSDEFYRNCLSVLRPGGIVSVQSGTPFYHAEQLERLLARLRNSFGAAKAFLAPVPTYAHGLLALIVAGRCDTFCPPLDVLREKVAGLRGGTSYYSPEVHHAAFVMAPSFDKELRWLNTELQAGR